MFKVFIDFPDGFNLGLYDSFDNLDNAKTHCQCNKDATKDVHFSVWKHGKCYYSTSPDVLVDVKVKK